MLKFCDSNLIWIALAVLVLTQTDLLNFGGLFGLGDETLIILAVVAFLFFSNGGLGFLETHD